VFEIRANALVVRRSPIPDYLMKPFAFRRSVLDNIDSHVIYSEAPESENFRSGSQTRH
jgi:hypothetical protein